MILTNKHFGFISLLSIPGSLNHALSRGLIQGLLSLALISTAYANPDQPTVVHGAATFESTDQLLEIMNSNGAIIDWQSFSIDRGELTRFIQDGSASKVLNRVIGGDLSNILGELKSNGEVFLINRNGIVFGDSAVIDTRGFLASTLEIDNQDFIDGILRFSGSGGAISNQGLIRVDGNGNIALIAPDIRNSGIIQTGNGQIVLAAGREIEVSATANRDITIKVQAPTDSVVNVGQIIAEQGTIGLFAGTLDQQGELRFTRDGNGNVFLEADSNTVSGTIDAPGGEVHVLGDDIVLRNSLIDTSSSSGGGQVLIGGDYQGGNGVRTAQTTTIDGSSVVKADGNQSGDGGEIIVWSESQTRVDGLLSARGGAEGGDGGLIEISSRGELDFTQPADVSAQAGEPGTWLIDPEDINIDSGKAESIESALNQGSNVSIKTSDSGDGEGNISVNAAITKTEGEDASLSLDAHNRIDVNAPITSEENKLSVSLVAGTNVEINSDIDTNGGGLATVITGIESAPEANDEPEANDKPDALDEALADGNEESATATGESTAEAEEVAVSEEIEAVDDTVDEVIEEVSNAIAGIEVNADVITQGGDIEIDTQSFGDVVISGMLDASTDEIDQQGATISIEADDLLVEGSLLARNDSGLGGQIDITGTDIRLLSADLDASGETGGGRIRIGGEYQGGKDLVEDELPNAQRLLMDRNSTVKADGLGFNSSGGEVILWSDEHTIALGNISVRQAANADEAETGTTGGSVEVSSQGLLNYDGTITAGQGGTVLFDPKNAIVDNIGVAPIGDVTNFLLPTAATISTISPNVITALTNAGAAVFIRANNDVTIKSSIITNNPGGDGGDLSFQAGRNFTVQNGADIFTDNGNLTVITNETIANGVVDAQRDAGNAGITTFLGSDIDAGTGTVTLTTVDDNIKTNSGSGNTFIQGNINSNNLSVEGAFINVRGDISATNSVTLTSRGNTTINQGFSAPTINITTGAIGAGRLDITPLGAAPVVVESTIKTTINGKNLRVLGNGAGGSATIRSAVVDINLSEVLTVSGGIVGGGIAKIEGTAGTINIDAASVGIGAFNTTATSQIVDTGTTTINVTGTASIFGLINSKDLVIDANVIDIEKNSNISSTTSVTLRAKESVTVEESFGSQNIIINGDTDSAGLGRVRIAPDGATGSSPVVNSTVSTTITGDDLDILGNNNGGSILSSNGTLDINITDTLLISNNCPGAVCTDTGIIIAGGGSGDIDVAVLRMNQNGNSPNVLIDASNAADAPGRSALSITANGVGTDGVSLVGFATGAGSFNSIKGSPGNKLDITALNNSRISVQSSGNSTVSIESGIQNLQAGQFLVITTVPATASIARVDSGVDNQTITTNNAAAGGSIFGSALGVSGTNGTVAINGANQIFNVQNGGALQIGEAANLSTTQFNATGTSTFNITGNTNIFGGAGPDSASSITAGTVDLNLTGVLNVTGGAGNGAIAKIEGTGNTIDINANTVTVQSGTGTNADASLTSGVGNGAINVTTTGLFTVLGALVDANTGDININGGGLDVRNQVNRPGGTFLQTNGGVVTINTTGDVNVTTGSCVGVCGDAGITIGGGGRGDFTAARVLVNTAAGSGNAFIDASNAADAGVNPALSFTTNDAVSVGHVTISSAGGRNSTISAPDGGTFNINTTNNGGIAIQTAQTSNSRLNSGVLNVTTGFVRILNQGSGVAEINSTNKAQTFNITGSAAINTNPSFRGIQVFASGNNGLAQIVGGTQLFTIPDGTVDVKIGDTVQGRSPSLIQSTGTSTLNIGGDLLVIGGGLFPGATASLNAATVNITTPGTVSLTGGSTIDSSATIVATDLNTINIDADTVTLQGGSGDNTDATIISGGGAGTINLTVNTCNNCDPITPGDGTDVGLSFTPAAPAAVVPLAVVLAAAPVVVVPVVPPVPTPVVPDPVPVIADTIQTEVENILEEVVTLIANSSIVEPASADVTVPDSLIVTDNELTEGGGTLQCSP